MMDSILQDSLFGHQIQFHNHLVSIRIEKNNVDNLYWLELFLVPENPTLIRWPPYYRIVFSGTKFSYTITRYSLEYKKIMQTSFIGLNYFWCPKTLSYIMKYFQQRTGFWGKRISISDQNPLEKAKIMKYSFWVPEKPSPN